MEHMEQWKVAVIHGYRYLGNVENRRSSTGGVAPHQTVVR